jgi:hypothetical protein
VQFKGPARCFVNHFVFNQIQNMWSQSFSIRRLRCPMEFYFKEKFCPGSCLFETRQEAGIRSAKAVVIELLFPSESRIPRPAPCLYPISKSLGPV